jgi:histidine triad (HIT) family protein
MSSKFNQNCPFCKIAQSNDPNALILWENDFVSCFLPLEMEVYGHVLIIPKNHFENIFDIDEENIAELGKGIRFVANGLKKHLKADGINILNANGKAAGQSVSHLHFHIMPRFENDQLDLWPKIPKNDFDRIKFFEKLKNRFVG